MTRQLRKRLEQLEARIVARQRQSSGVVFQWIRPTGEVWFDSEEYFRERAEKERAQRGDGSSDVS